MRVFHFFSTSKFLFYAFGLGGGAVLMFKEASSLDVCVFAYVYVYFMFCFC